jgi:hypothetical protein
MDVVSMVKQGGVTPGTVDIVKPNFTGNYWDSCFLRVTTRDLNPVHHSFERNASSLVGALRSLSVHEAHQLTGGDPPSNDDLGPEYGSLLEIAQQEMIRIATVSLRLFNKAIVDAESAVAA